MNGHQQAGTFMPRTGKDLKIAGTGAIIRPGRSARKEMISACGYNFWRGSIGLTLMQCMLRAPWQQPSFFIDGGFVKVRCFFVVD